MPRYFIDMRSRFGCDEDLVGVDLASASVARGEALRVATLKLQGRWQDLPDEAKSQIAIEIVGEAGQIVLVVPSWEIEQHLKATQLLQDQGSPMPLAGWSPFANTLLERAVLLAGTVTTLALVLV